MYQPSMVGALAGGCLHASRRPDRMGSTWTGICLPICRPAHRHHCQQRQIE